jgi:hypothetical protein
MNLGYNISVTRKGKLTTTVKEDKSVYALKGFRKIGV